MIKNLQSFAGSEMITLYRTWSGHSRRRGEVAAPASVTLAPATSQCTCLVAAAGGATNHSPARRAEALWRPARVPSWPAWRRSTRRKAAQLEVLVIVHFCLLFPLD